ncbi:NAD-dependent epimerase/dehydratase family protein [Rathayibacter toxicus]|nr:NAD-dependent epimerase/dehydratase family protein [Rathayibacter toxicus]QOD10422.1 NAD-dependent epimerase/dehydratase family protein [Rathayibacter toxicus]QWL26967.1 NAD-dependent epimerase/dehydratase family protein [Rathayibacter toxicus]QWL29090.1 NAD-dependent epimerase/dehydratase family protein [Rathayibacter toxicus]QWL31180.1 NAD-dependent epimerase/dehydratase family protein [Rathayibacter toxicus]
MAKILVLGGTRFLGVHLVERLLGAGHRVTLLNRGENRGTFTHSPIVLT